MATHFHFVLAGKSEQCQHCDELQGDTVSSTSPGLDPTKHMILSSSQNICSREQKDGTTAETYSLLNYLRLYLTKLYNTKRTVTIAITQYNICFFCGSSNTCTKASRVIANAESPGSLVVKARSIPS